MSSAPPPRIVITTNGITSAMNGNGSKGKTGPSSEKIGRWTDTEHSVFLEGLEKHGKQWKTIASMIGTRTVVQVRTHAQKYFQKMERKNNPVPVGAPGVVASISAKPASAAPSTKRRSLPASLPSRKSRKGSGAGASPRKPRISISLGSLTHTPVPPPSVVCQQRL